LNIQQRSSPCS